MKRYLENPREVLAVLYRGPDQGLAEVKPVPNEQDSYCIEGPFGLQPISPGMYLVQDGELKFALTYIDFHERFTLHSEEVLAWEGLERCGVYLQEAHCVFERGHPEPCAFDNGLRMDEPIFRRDETKRELWERLREFLHDGTMKLGIDWGEPGGDSTVYYDELLQECHRMNRTPEGQMLDSQKEPYPLSPVFGQRMSPEPAESGTEAIASALLNEGVARDQEEPEHLPAQSRPIELSGVEIDGDPAEGREL